MIQNRRWQVGHQLLEQPAGTRNLNATPKFRAHRSLREETGYTADKLDPLPAFFAAPRVSTEIMHPYVATGLRFVGQKLELDEANDVIILSREQAMATPIDGTIVDGKTIAVLGRY